MDLKPQKIGKKWEFGGFWLFSQKVFNMGPWTLVYMHIVGTFRCVWKIVPVGQFFGPFMSQIGPK